MRKFSFKSFVSGVLVSTVVLVPALTFASNSQSIDVIFGKIKLIVNGKTLNKDTLLYNGTTYLPIRAVGEALGASVDYDATKYQATLTTSQSQSSDPQSTYWANKVYIVATKGNIDANKLIISNVTSSNFNYEFKKDDTSIIKGTATISGYSATSKVSDIYGINFEIHGDEISITETGKSQMFPDGIATYVHKTAMNTKSPSTNEGSITTNTYTNFKAGKYSAGSSANAKTLVISNVVAGKSFKYQVIAGNGKDIVTEGTATITSAGNAECVFSDDYTITLKDLKNDVIELKESSQKLFPYGGIKFYTV